MFLKTVCLQRKSCVEEFVWLTFLTDQGIVEDEPKSLSFLVKTTESLCLIKNVDWDRVEKTPLLLRFLLPDLPSPAGHLAGHLAATDHVDVVAG